MSRFVTTLTDVTIIKRGASAKPEGSTKEAPEESVVEKALILAQEEGQKR